MDLCLVFVLIVATQSTDIYRTYERVEHGYDYPEPKKDADKDKNDIQEYWKNFYSEGSDDDIEFDQEMEYKQEKQAGLVEDDIPDKSSALNNDNVADSNSREENSNYDIDVKLQMTTVFNDPNVPMCYNCYYSYTDGKADGKEYCDDENELFDSNAIVTVPCGSGFCSVTRTTFKDGGRMLIRGCMEDCQPYNTTMCTVQCCKGDRCNGPSIATYNEQTSGGTTDTLIYSRPILHVIALFIASYFTRSS